VAGATTLNRYSQQDIEEYQIYAKIDEKTSNQCLILHGTIFKVNSPEASRFHPPFHPRCRTSIIPVTIFTKIDNSMRYENRDFSQQINQDLTFSDIITDEKIIKKVFSDIDTFNEKYRISKFIFDEDLEKRYLRLGVGVNLDNKTEYLSKKLDNYNWKLKTLKTKYEKSPTKALFKDITLMEDNITELKEEIKLIK
jgi:NAD+--asparagine ADP-ribosyltransferase